MMVILCLFVFEEVAMTDLDDMMIRKTRGKPDRVTGDEMQGLDGKMGDFSHAVSRLTCPLNNFEPPSFRINPFPNAA